ncbi:MAG: hypothetical protein LBI11_00545 [Streptococcaceae bacterium]|jgi:type II secretory pathway pseudopilin PulG|nr:hypothetical protein [Streptococcaceae bacterium]
MENSRKRSAKAYILLESLLTLALLSAVTGILLTQISNSHKAIATDNARIEALNVAQMALATNQSKIEANGVAVTIAQSDKTLTVQTRGKELLTLEIQKIEPLEK